MELLTLAYSKELQDICEEGDPESEPPAASFDSLHQGGMSHFFIYRTDNHV